MSEGITTPCGIRKSRKGNLFTPESLVDHLRTCPRIECAALRKEQKQRHPKMIKVVATESDPDPLGLLDDDMPDGAYWAMHNEIYGW